MKFSMCVLMLVVGILIFLGLPIYHQMADRDLRPALTINLDSLSMLVGLLGVSVLSTVVSLHRRIASLEKAASTGPQGSKS